jgi:hypothetical protein
VHWRFSDAGRRSAWIASSCRRPKTCTTSDVIRQRSSYGRLRLPRGQSVTPLREKRCDRSIRFRVVFFELAKKRRGGHCVGKSIAVIPTMRSSPYPIELDGRYCVSSSERMRILATMQSHQRLIIPLAAALVFIVAGLSLVQGFRGTMAAAPSSSVVHAPTVEQVSNEILETAKGLGITQQEAVDQLQVVQDQLAQRRRPKSFPTRSQH